MATRGKECGRTKRVKHARLILGFSWVLTAACRDSPKETKARSSAASVAAATASARPFPTATSAGTERVLPVSDAGRGTCRIVQLSTRGPGPVRFEPDADRLDLFVNHGGDLERDQLRIAALDAPALPPLPSSEEVKPLSLPCGATREYVFCMDREGRVLRRARSAPDVPPKEVARSLPGATLSAADSNGHAVVAFLAKRKTTEGVMTEAWAVIDDAPPLRISEDGAGATSVDVAPRGSGVIFAYVDARTAMTPVHARHASEKNGHLELGRDAVVFVGGAPDTHVAGVLGVSREAAFFVMPLAKDIATFGMAIIKLDDPPAVDEPVTWAMYPNGIDPAPIAATRDVSPIHLLRVVPSTNDPNGPRVVELGQIAASGDFRSLGAIAQPLQALYVSVAVDRFGAIWTQHGDSSGSFVERRKCP